MKNFNEQQKRRESPTDMLKNMLDGQSRQTNEMVEKEYGLKDLLLRDTALNPQEYTELYGEEAVRADADFVHKCELDFSSANNPNVQAFYLEKYGAKTEEEVIAKWRENKSREKNGQMEMAVTALLAQKLGKDFLVVRTAPYDDYKNGVDNLIFDRTTGEVVGAFDEVHEVGTGQRTKEKELKIKKIVERGGAKIQYGLKFVDGKFIRGSLEGVPVFYLGLESSELLELEEGLHENDATKTNKIFKKLISALASQHAMLEKSAGSSGVRARLNSFGQTLSRLNPEVQK
ncbi:MAG: hypothetical protein WC870_02085 [Candidatus Paceibacterota bacterium]